MPSDLDLHGVWVPLITPFDASGSVDIEAIERLCGEYLADGVAGIVALGTTGEAPALDAGEKDAVIAACSRACAARNAPLIVGTGTNNTRSTIAATNAIAGIPAVAAALVVVPYYIRPSEAAIVEHYRVVAAASPVPVIVYNIPSRTGRGLGSAALLEVARIPNVAGVKQAVGALDADTLEVLAGAPAGFSLLGGDEAFAFPTVCMGGVGAIAAASHLCTARFVAMIDCALAGKIDDGRAHSEALLPMIQAGFSEPNPAVFKGVLHAQGRIAAPDVRMPLANASAAAIERCLTAVSNASH
ncbi:MAG: 4-hydroxy-tetrahydrodipicolinate synthase [Actinomycetota bacterium]|nr:4-hydroxy-tetrahydrodipicolinate synthase [Actinomycetota bacterium]